MIQVGNALFVVEYWINDQRSIWKITLPSSVSFPEIGADGLTLSVFPDPVTDQLNWRSDKPVLAITLFNAQGAELRNTKTRNSNGSLDLTGFARGSYYARFLVEVDWVNKPFVVVR